MRLSFTNMRTALPTVFLLIDSSRAYERALLKGIARYSQMHGPWIFVHEGPFWEKHSRQDLLERMKSADGIIMREGPFMKEILGLRMSIAPGEAFVPLLSRYLDRFQRQWGIATELVLSDGADHAAMYIEPSHEIQLLRVMQEALTNVRRHAKAGRVVVAIADSPQALTMTIEDNGVGFDQSLVDDERLGIRIMRERAISVKGTLDVRSSPGSGAVIQMQLPKLASRPGGGQ